LFRRICALRMRVSMSPRGSVMTICRVSLPARLDEARDEPGGAEIAKGDARHLQLAVEAARAAGDLAAVADARRRRIAGQLGQLELGLEALLKGQALVAGDRLQLPPPGGVTGGQLAAPLVLLDRTLLGHRCPRGSGGAYCRKGKL